MFTPEWHDRLRELFLAARALDEPARRAYLDAACAGDEMLRKEIDLLLSSDGSHPEFLDRPALGTGFRLRTGEHADTARSVECAPGVALEIGRRIAAATGQYRVETVLGQGAMATVFRAEQLATGRVVAFKVVRASVADSRLVARLRHEAHVLGRLHHPGIAQIYDAGVVDLDGETQPYFAMEYVDGRSLLDHADRARLSTTVRLDLLRRIAEALHHAHARGIVHRDLKPDNIMVTPGGDPKILDFGIARATDMDLRTATLHTAVGQLLGTVQYMSPEQAAGDAPRLDARSDVYALGVVAFELLCGRLPYAVHEKPLPEALRIIRDDEPTRLGTVDGTLRGDAETIVGRALEKEPERRYASAKAFADDVSRLLRDEPILARPPTTLYQLRKFARRNRTLVVGVAALLVVLVAATIVSLLLAASARRQRDRAQWNAYVANIVAAGSALDSGTIASAKAMLAAAPERLRGWEWFHLARRADASLRTMDEHDYWAWSVALDPSGSRVASAAGDGTVRIWDLATGREERVLREHTNRVFAVAWSPDGTRLASGSGDETIRLRDGATFETVSVMHDHEERVFSLAFSPDSRRLVSGGANGRVFVWDAATGRRLAALLGHTDLVWSVTFSPDGARIASASNDDTIRLWDAERGETLDTLTGHDGDVHAVTFSPDGVLLASGGLDGTVRLWDAATGAAGPVMEGHTDWVGAVAFTPAGTEIVSAGNDAMIRAWDVASGDALATLHGHEECARAIAIAPGGERIVSASFDSTLKVWDTSLLRERLAPRHYDDVRWFAFTSDDRLLIRDTSGWIEVVDRRTGVEQRRLEVGAGRFFWRCNASSLLVSGDAGALVIVDAGTGTMLRDLGETGVLAFVPEIGRLAASRPDGSVRIVDVATGRVVTEFQAHDELITSIALSHDGDLVATGSKDETARIWDGETGALRTSIEGLVQTVRALAFTTDGRGLVVATHDRTMTLRDTGDGRTIVTYPRHESIPTTIAIDPTGTRLATGTNEGVVRIWNLEGGEPLLTLPGRPETIIQIAFSPDGTLLGVLAGTRLFIHDGRPRTTATLQAARADR